MEAYVVEIVLAVITTILTTIAGLWIKHLYKKMNEKEERAKREAAEKEADEKRRAAEQQKEFDRLLKEEQARTYRQMIVDEIEPIVVELSYVKKSIDNKTKEFENYIKKDEKEFEKKIGEISDNHDADKEEFAEKLHELEEEYEDKLRRILESYKFRFIQLCKVHIRTGSISPEEFDQIVAFYDVYHGLGGNGQAEEDFNKVKDLKIKLDNESNDNEE